MSDCTHEPIEDWHDYCPDCGLTRDEVDSDRELNRLRTGNAAALEALTLVQRVFDEALPKFNWGASALDGNAIDLLNRGPIAVHAALKELRNER